uniref:WD_REPEATS_REGION domain-containing protein n=1 Tax=Heterorhabditis bacteriophora TaxID=37862 RepID=A0A1I7XTG8_HETBA
MANLHTSKKLRGNEQKKRDSRMHLSSSCRLLSRSASLEPTRSYLECSRSSSFDSSLASIRDNENNITPYLHESSEQSLNTRDESYESYDSHSSSPDRNKSVTRRMTSTSFNDGSLDISKVKYFLRIAIYKLHKTANFSRKSRQPNLYRIAIMNNARRSLYDPYRSHMRGMADKDCCQESVELSLHNSLDHSCHTNDLSRRSHLPLRHVQFTKPKKFVRSQSTAPRMRTTSMRLPERSRSFSCPVHFKQVNLKLALTTPLYIRSNQWVHIEPGTGEIVVVTNVVLQSKNLSHEERQKDLDNLVKAKPALSNSKTLEDDGKQDQKSTQTVLVGKNMMIIERKTILQRSKPNATVRTNDIRKYDNICEGRLGPVTKRPRWDVVNAILENGINVEKEMYHKTEKIVLLFGKPGKKNSKPTKISNTSNKWVFKHQLLCFFCCNVFVEECPSGLSFYFHIFFFLLTFNISSSITIVRDTLIDARDGHAFVWNSKHGFFAEEKRSYDYQKVNIDGSLFFTPSTINESRKTLSQRDLREAIKDEIKLMRKIRSKTPEESLERQKNKDTFHGQERKLEYETSKIDIGSEKTQTFENYKLSKYMIEKDKSKSQTPEIIANVDVGELTEKRKQPSAQKEESKNLKSLILSGHKKEGIRPLEEIDRKEAEITEKMNEEQEKIVYEKMHKNSENTGDENKKIQKTGSAMFEKSVDKELTGISPMESEKKVTPKKHSVLEARNLEPHTSKIQELTKTSHEVETHLDQNSMQQMSDVTKNQEIRIITPSKCVESVNPSPTVYFDALSKSFTGEENSYRSRSPESRDVNKTILPNSALSSCNSTDDTKISSLVELKYIKRNTTDSLIKPTGSVPKVTEAKCSEDKENECGNKLMAMTRAESSFTPERISLRAASSSLNRSCPATIRVLETTLNVPTNTSGSTSNIFTIVKPMIVIATINGKEYKLTTNFSIIVKTVAVQAIDYEESPKNN